MVVGGVGGGAGLGEDRLSLECYPNLRVWQKGGSVHPGAHFLFGQAPNTLSQITAHWLRQWHVPVQESP